MLIKEIGLYPIRNGIGEFQQCPELVEGILTVIDKKYGKSLLNTFLKEGKSCVVSYHTPLSIDLYYLASSVLVYLNRKLLNKEGKISCCNHDAKNNSILIENIITVELIEYDKLKRAILNLYKY